MVHPVELAKALIACESVTPQEAGTFDLLQGWLEGLGFTVRRVTFEEAGFEPTENLYARLGDSAPNLCFAGHVDVVPPGELSQWRHPPFAPTVENGVLYGRGAEDMKAAIACFVAAVERFLEGESLLLTPPRERGEEREQAPSPVYRGGLGRGKGSISLLLTADEEGIGVNGTQKMLAWLAEQGERLDACLVGEPTNPSYLGEMMKVGRRGSLNGHLIIRGRQGHVAYPHLADNPLHKLVNVLNEMQHHALDEGTAFFPPSSWQLTSLEAVNMTSNLIPATAQARFNIRFNDRHSGASLEEWLRGVCAHWCGADGFELACHVSGEAFLTRDEALRGALVAAVLDVTGHTPQLSTTGGTSDARFIKDYCPTIEFGTTGATAHQVNEAVRVDVLEQLTAVYLRFLNAYLAD